MQLLCFSSEILPMVFFRYSKEKAYIRVLFFNNLASCKVGRRSAWYPGRQRVRILPIPDARLVPSLFRSWLFERNKKVFGITSRRGLEAVFLQPVCIWWYNRNREIASSNEQTLCSRETAIIAMAVDDRPTPATRY